MMVQLEPQKLNCLPFKYAKTNVNIIVTCNFQDIKKTAN